MGIQKKGKNKWKLIVEKYKATDGKRVRVCETFEGLKSEAEARYAQMKAEVKCGTYIENKKLTMKELLEKWLEYRKENISPKTFNTYKIYTKNIIDEIGAIELIKISPKILEDFYINLKNKTNYSPKSILEHYRIINASLNKAVIWGYIAINPNIRVEKPKTTKPEISCYSPEEVKDLIKALETEPYKRQALIILALDTGARRGELLALNWKDINLEDGSVIINKSIQYTPERGIFEKSTKTENSNRKIYISETTIKVLRKHEKEQLEMRLKLGKKWYISDKVFTTDDGNLMHPDTAGRILTSILKKNNLRKVSFHGLRHTSISLMINSGIQAQIISRKAGHSSVQVTDRIYSHFFEDEFKDTAYKMESYLSVR